MTRRRYSLGSAWGQVPPGQATFTVAADGSTQALATVTGTPPLSPSAATVFFYGTAKYGLVAKLLDDAPEQSE